MRPGLRSLALALALSAFAAGWALGAESADEQIELAVDHYRHQRWQAACDAFAELLSSDVNPAHACDVRYYYGEALMELGRWQQAREQYAELLKREPNHRFAKNAAYRSGEAALAAGDPASAQRELEAFRQRYPKDELSGWALSHLATIDYEANRREAGDKLCRAAIEAFPDSQPAEACRLWLAKSQRVQGQLDAAADGFKQIANAGGPLADQAAVDWGRLEAARGQHAAALAALARIGPDSPWASDARLTRGYCLYASGMYPEAEAELAPLANHPKLQVDANAWIGRSQAARKDYDTAARTFIAAGKLDPNSPLNPSITLGAADALTSAGQISAAQEQLDLVLNRWPGSTFAAAALYAKMMIAMSANDRQRCLSLAEQFADTYAQSPLSAEVFLVKGQALAKLGRYAEAAEALGVVSKMEPRVDVDAAARVELGRALVRLGRMDEAKAAIDKMPPGEAAKGEIPIQVAEILASAGDLERAAERFSALAKRELSPELSVRALIGLAGTRFDLQQSVESLATCRQLMAKYPQSQEAAHAALLAGQIFDRNGDSAAAREMYQIVYDKHAESRFAAEALRRAANSFDVANQSLPAIKLYQRIVDSRPEISTLDEAIHRLAWLHQQQGHKAQADVMFERLEREFPKSPLAVDAILHHANQAITSGKLVEASNLVAKVELADASPTLRQNVLLVRSRISFASQRWAEAEQRLKELLATDLSPKEELAARFQLAASVYFQRRYTDALDQYKELADRTADDPPAWAMAQLQRAKALAQLRQWAEALEIAHSIAPRCENFAGMYEVDYLIGRAFAVQADFTAAREAFARVLVSPAIQNTETAALTQCMIGESYFHQENYQAALDAYLKVERDHATCRWTPSALAQAGKCQEAIGHWQDAQQLYERLLKQYPAYRSRAEIAQRLSVAKQRAAKDTSKLK